MFRAINGVFVVDCGFVMGEGEFSELRIEFLVEWGCSDTILDIEYAQIVCFQENNCIATHLIHRSVQHIYMDCKVYSRKRD